MFAMLRGKVLERSEGKITVDVNGVGYEVSVPLSMSVKEDEMVNLYIKTLVREDDISLYGFKDKEEKNIFTLLKSVSGVGSKTALAIISFYNTNDLCSIIISKNSKSLSKVPGIGLKTAERLIVELKDKFEKGIAKNFTRVDDKTGEYEDLFNALLGLGFKPLEAEKALKNKIDDIKLKKPIEKILREILQGLA